VQEAGKSGGGGRGAARLQLGTPLRVRGRAAARIGRSSRPLVAHSAGPAHAACIRRSTWPGVPAHAAGRAAEWPVVLRAHRECAAQRQAHGTFAHVASCLRLGPIAPLIQGGRRRTIAAACHAADHRRPVAGERPRGHSLAAAPHDAKRPQLAVLSGRATLARAQVVTRAMTEAGDDEYNDLDELVARYAEPYMRNVEAVTKHRRAPAPAPAGAPARRRCVWTELWIAWWPYAMRDAGMMSGPQ